MFFLCWSSLGGHLFGTPSMSYISVNFTHYNYKFMPWCGYCKVFLSPALCSESLLIVLLFRNPAWTATVGYSISRLGFNKFEAIELPV